jgi:outer membrane cobalamin receptor
LVLPLLCAAETTTVKAPADTLAKKRYLLPTVRVIAEKPGDTVGALHLVDYQSQQGVSALNLYEGLQEISGLTNTAGTRDESNLRIRGFRKNEVKVLVDGRPLNIGYFGNVDLHQLSPGAIREIQIVKGPGSAIYGTGTMGGVVNIITADPDNSGWLTLDVLAKRNNTNRLALSSTRRIGGLTYFVTFAREHHEGIVLPEDFTPTPFENGGVRNHSRKTQYDFQTRVGYSFSGFRDLEATAGISYIPEKLIPSSIYALDYRQYVDWMHYWGTLQYEEVLNEFWKASSHLYYDGGQDTYQQFNDFGHQSISVDSDMRYYTLGLNPRFKWEPDGRNSLDFGMRVESLHSTRKDNGSYPDWTPHWLNIYNVFGQWTHKASQVVSLVGSLGASSHQSDLKHTLSLYPEPSASMVCKFSESSESSLSFGRNISFPTMRQMFSAENGNPDLKPQHAFKYELDHQQGVRIGKLLLSNRISFYYNDMRDLIDRVGETYQNIDRVRSWGLEYSLMFKPFGWWSSEMGYARLDWESDTDYRLTETPRNQAFFRQDWLLPWKLTLSHDCSYTDIRYSQDASDAYHTLHSYWLNDLSLSRSFGKINAALGLENIFDAYYETEYGFPGAGLNFFIKLSAEI